MKFLVNVQPIAEPGQPAPPAQFAFNTVVDAPNPLAAIDAGRLILDEGFKASGLLMADPAPTGAPAAPLSPAAQAEIDRIRAGK